MEIKSVKTQAFPIHNGICKRILLGLMKMFVFLLCATTFGFTTESALAQKKIEIEYDKTVSVDEVFDIITDQTNYSFLYPADMFKDAPKVYLKKGKLAIGKLLQQTLPKGKFNVILGVNDRITIKQKKSNQQIQITGKVTDNEGIPIPGVTVLIKGTTSGRATDLDGFYSIPVPDPANVLVFTALGFKKQEITVGSQRVIDVVLQENVEALEQVVVSDGYRTISKERVTGSYVNITTEQIERQVTNDVLGSLEGLAPGLTLNSTANGLPGADVVPSLFIRGIGSFGNIAPLLVLDGFPIEADQLSLINTQDIASVNVLRDAAAASIWGSGAANGVIVITTKKGTQEKTQFTLRNVTTIGQRPSLDYLNLVGPTETIAYERALFFNDPDDLPDRAELEGLSSAYPKSYDIFFDFAEGNINEAEMERRLAALATVDNRRDVERTFLNAPVTNTTNFSFNGKTDKMNYFGSLAHINEEGAFSGDKNCTTTVNLNTDYLFSEKTKFNLILNYFTEEQDISPLRETSSSSSNVPNLLLISPYENLFDGQGNPATVRRWYPQSTIDAVLNAGGKDLSYKPLQDLNDQVFTINRESIRFNVSLEQKLFKGLTATVSHQYLKANTIDERLYRPESFFTRNLLTEFSEATFTDGVLTDINQVFPDGGIKSSNIGSSTSNITRVQLDYENSSNDRKHFFNALVGLERRKLVDEGNVFTRFGFNESNLLFSLIDQNTQILSNPFDNSVTSFELAGFNNVVKIDTRISSYYFNGGYSYDRRYDLNIAGRIDRSSQFSRNKEFLGSVGLKWNVTNESFFNVDWFNNLSVRATWGILGNSPQIGDASLSTTAFPNLNTNTALPGLIISNPANRDLTFETVETRNIAIDFSLFNSRISGSLDYYNRISTNVLAQGDIDPTQGFFTITKNIADITNKGFEIQLRTRNIVSDNFKWSTDINFSKYENTVERSTVDRNRAFRSRSVQLEGFPTFSVFGYRFAGLDENGVPQAFFTNEEGVEEPTTVVGDIAFEDLKQLGTTVPTITIGAGNTLNYKRFELFFRFIYNGGHILRRESISNRLVRATALDNGFLTGYNQNILNFWQQPGDENTTDVPNLSSVLQTRLREDADVGYDDADFLKLRQLILSYTLGGKILENTPFSNARVYFQGDNLWFWAKNNDGIDPEAYLIESGERTLPIVPSYSLGLTLNF